MITPPVLKPGAVRTIRCVIPEFGEPATVTVLDDTITLSRYYCPCCGARRLWTANLDRKWHTCSACGRGFDFNNLPSFVDWFDIEEMQSAAARRRGVAAIRKAPIVLQHDDPLVAVLADPGC